MDIIYLNKAIDFIYSNFNLEAYTTDMIMII